MKLIFWALLGFGFLSASVAWACPKKNGEGSISEHSVREYLLGLSSLSSGFQKNQLIENCFDQSKALLNWEQVRILLTGLDNTGSPNSGDGNKTQNRITGSFLVENISLEKTSPRLAVTISQYQTPGFDTNILIEKYFNANRLKLSWSSVKVLTSGLVSMNNSNTLDNNKTQDRITDSYLVANISLERTSPREAVAISQKQTSGFDTNILIEKYFTENRFELSRSDVSVLTSGLVNMGGTTKFDYHETFYRILLSWNGCETALR